ncbi:hypothetical protein CHUAL_011676 [Chamberlinius hualienensis]
MATIVKSGDIYAKLGDEKHINVKLNKESDTEVIISALEMLQLKLKQLEDERNAASKLINRLSQSGENLLNSWTLRNNFRKAAVPPDIQSHCDIIEQQLVKILTVVRQNDSEMMMMSKSATENVKTPNAVKSDSKVTKIKHFKPDCRSLPFIPSGPSSTTFSLPATIQTLLSNLKSQHNQLCVAAHLGNCVKDIIEGSEIYLQELAETLQNSVQYLNIECLRFSSEKKQSGDMLDARILTTISQLETLVKISQQIVELQKKIAFLKKQVHSMTKFEIQTKSESVTKVNSNNNISKKSTHLSVQSPQKRSQPPKVKKEANVHPFHRHVTKKPLIRSESNAKVVHPNVETLKYIKLLQVALRRNGYRLKMTED